VYPLGYHCHSRAFGGGEKSHAWREEPVLKVLVLLGKLLLCRKLNSQILKGQCLFLLPRTQLPWQRDFFFRLSFPRSKEVLTQGSLRIFFPTFAVGNRECGARRNSICARHLSQSNRSHGPVYPEAENKRKSAFTVYFARTMAGCRKEKGSFCAMTEIPHATPLGRCCRKKEKYFPAACNGDSRLDQEEKDAHQGSNRSTSWRKK